MIDAALDVLGATKKASQAPSARPLSFALVRPPGHHAGADDTPGHRAEGFCFFNSAAVAAGVVLERGLAQKVCILDWDVHHGNGTQQLFYGDSRMLYLSLHRYGDRWYPETGAADEVGEGKGKGATVNVPWPENGMSDNDYYAAFELVLLPILKARSCPICQPSRRAWAHPRPRACPHIFLSAALTLALALIFTPALNLLPRAYAGLLARSPHRLRGL